MNKEEIEQYKTITQELFKEQYNSIKDLGNRELRKVIENSNWNFILQIIRHLENEIFILEQEKDQLETNRDEVLEMINTQVDDFESDIGMWKYYIEQIQEILERGKEC